MNSVRSDRKYRNQTMRLSTVEGSVTMVTLGLQMAFFIPFLNELGASNFQVSLGAGLPALLIGLIQLAGPYTLRKTGSYRLFIALSAVAQAVCFLPLAMIAWKGSLNAVWLSICFLCLSSIPFGIQMSAWSNWMSHLVPRKRRGKYFAIRNRIVTMIQFLTTLVGGYILDYGFAKVMLMYAIIWLAAFLARLIAGGLIAMHYEPPVIREIVKEETSFIQFIKEVRSTMFGRFAVAVSLFHCTVHMAAPFFPIHMQNNLNFSYLQYSVMFFIPIFVSVLVMGLWGRFSDRMGYVLPMRICVILICASSFTWVVTESFEILLINQIFVGIGWAGFNLTAFNYSISAIDSRKRTSSLAYMNTVIFICVFFGAILGGVMASRLPAILNYRLKTLFLVSTGIRLISLAIFFTLKDCEKHTGPLTPVERFFFYPLVSYRTAIVRFFSGFRK